jgi:hypothetical protein
VAEQVGRPTTLSPSAMSSTSSMWTSGKLARNGEIHPPRRRGQLGRVQLLNDLQVAAVEDLVNQPPDSRFVLFGHGRSLVSGASQS